MPILTEPFLWPIKANPFIKSCDASIVHRVCRPERCPGTCTRLDRPYESQNNEYLTIVDDGRLVRLYYRAVEPAAVAHTMNKTNNRYQRTCVAFSEDGIVFTKPSLPHHAFGKTPKTNIIHNSHLSHNLTVVRAKGNKGYIGIASFGFHNGYKPFGVHLMRSDDGIKWGETSDHILSPGDALPGFSGAAFDSLSNLVYSPFHARYLLFLRHNVASGVRKIQFTSSANLKNWLPCAQISFVDKDDFSIYSSNITRYPNSSYFVAFPCVLDGNDKMSKRVNLMFSYNGVTWYRSVRDSLAGSDFQGPHNAAVGIVSRKGAFYMYMYDTRQHEVTRYRYRQHGMACLCHTSGPPGKLVSRRLTGCRGLWFNFKVTGRGGYLDVTVSSEKSSTRSRLCGNRLKHPIQIPPGKNIQITVTFYRATLYSVTFDGDA